jgi:hypothetical protein
VNEYYPHFDKRIKNQTGVHACRFNFLPAFCSLQ